MNIGLAIKRVCIYPLAAVVALAVIVLFALTLAQAHDWYPPECCSGRDCFRVDADELVETRSGDWLYVPRNITFPRDKVRPSQDRHFHVCIGNSAYNDGQPLCAFVLQGS
jgi:hypothetical protein